MPAAAAEGLVVVEPLARDVELVRIGEHALVAVGRQVPEQDAVVLLDRLAVQLDVARRRARHERERGEAAQPLLDGGLDQLRALAQQRELLGILHQGEHRRAVGRARRVVARRHQQDEEDGDLDLVELLAVDLGVHQRGDEIVARISRRSSICSFTYSMISLKIASVSRPLLADLRVLERGEHVRPVHERRVVLGRRAEQRADHPRRDRRATSATRSKRSRSATLSRTRLMIWLIVTLVLGDAVRGERLVHQRLEPVVARRVHRDHLQPLHVERHPDVVDVEDAAPLGGERLEVAGHGAHVLVAGDRPEAALVRRGAPAR